MLKFLHEWDHNDMVAWRNFTCWQISKTRRYWSQGPYGFSDATPSKRAKEGTISGHSIFYLIWFPSSCPRLKQWPCFYYHRSNQLSKFSRIGSFRMKFSWPALKNYCVSCVGRGFQLLVLRLDLRKLFYRQISAE